MPMHDWTQVDATAFHDFRRLWVAELARVLTGGLLPQELTAATEPDGSGLGVRHVNGRHDLARVEVVSPELKSDAAALDAFVKACCARLAGRTHLLLIDPLP